MEITIMADVNTRKRGSKWEYYFEIAKVGEKRKRISKGGFATKSLAQAAGVKALNEYNNTGIKFVPSEISVSDYLDYWLKMYCQVNLKPATVENYRKRINLHIKPKIGKYKLSNINPSILQELINEMFQNNYSRNTLLTIKGILTSSFNYAVQPLNYIKVSPMLYVKIPKSNSNENQRSDPHVFIPKREIEKIFERFPEGTTAFLPLLLGYHCGMRLGEAFAITWDNIDFDNKTITIDKQLQWNSDNKSWYLTLPKYNSIRTIDIDEIVVDALRQAKNKQEKAKVYYEDLYTTIYYDSNKNINTKSGTPIYFVNVRDNGDYIQPRIMQHASAVIHRTYPEFDFHSLRHTHCTMCLESGLPIKYVQERLGHKNIKFTMDIYNHLTENQAKLSKSKLESIF